MTPKFRGYSQIVPRELIRMGISYTGNGWVEGYLIQEGNDSYIINGVIEANSEYITIREWIPVFTDSIGRATGLQDKNGKTYYEGDLVKWDNEIFQVKFDRYQFVLEGFYEPRQDVPSDFFSEGAYKDSEIVGNIYENPNLLEEES